MKNIFREPLLHFLLIGALLFVAFALFQGRDAATDTRIVITQGDIGVLQANFARTWQRPPTRQELDGLLENKIREEIAYREAVALGLDANDAYIRQRLRTKLELVLEDISGLDPQSDEELAQYLAQHPDKFRREAQVGFSQLYLGEQPSAQDAARVLAQLAEAGAGADLESFGEPIMLPQAIPVSTLSTIDRQFGDGFAGQLEDLPAGQWQGPVKSGYGYHLVLVHEKVAGSDPVLGMVRGEVERELMSERVSALKEETYAGLRDKYESVIETGDGQDP